MFKCHSGSILLTPCNTNGMVGHRAIDTGVMQYNINTWL